MRYGLFERFGIELEYMLVRQDTFDIAPIADVLLFEAGADVDGDLQRGEFAWSNELTNHVVELKTARPVPTLDGLQSSLHAELRWFQEVADRHRCTLLPTAMHPWMNPGSETVLWPHGNADIYQTYDRIFHCQGHGWANVQSTHLNLSFSDEQEFSRLHAAIRLILPLLPAIAASSPVVEGKLSGQHDSRLFFYRDNQSRVPEIAGSVIPEPIYSEEGYRSGIFDPISAAMAKLDPGGILELDFLNSRGAIARFDRGSIEIRLLDVQECPAADVAIVDVVTEALRWICKHAALDSIMTVPTSELVPLLWRTALEGENAIVDVEAILELCGFSRPVSAATIWQAIFDEVGTRLSRASLKTFATLLICGTLSTRLRKALGESPDRSKLERIYRRLGECLSKNHLFKP